MNTSKFVIHLHQAKRAGRHYDIRFKMPDSKLWASFACKKEIPLSTGIKVAIFRTHDHSEQEALMVGEIPEGYGAGHLSVWDEGSCIIHKFNPVHMSVEFKGRKIKGIYHFINMNQVTHRSNKERAYLFFKGKTIE